MKEFHTEGVSEESAFLITNPENRLQTLITICYSICVDDGTLRDKGVQLTFFLQIYLNRFFDVIFS